MNDEHDEATSKFQERPNQPGSNAVSRTSPSRKQSEERQVEAKDCIRQPSNEPTLQTATTGAELAQVIAVESSTWSGIIPDPNVFSAYTPEVQEKWLRWADATILDESARQDRLVDAQIEQAKTGQGLAVLFGATLILASVVSAFWLHSPVLAAIFLSLPAIKLVTGFIIELGNSKKAKENPTE